MGAARAALARVDGAQLAGVTNIVARSARGAQLAGVVNLAQHRFEGAQLAGVVNVNQGEMQGAQLAGVANMAAGRVEGSQIAGIANYAQTLHAGAQIGLVNVNQSGRGAMIGLINYSGGFSGVPIGLVNVFIDGRMSMVSQFSHLGDIALELKSGTRSVYNVLSVSQATTSSFSRLGWGLGGQWRPTSRLSFDLDLMSSREFTVLQRRPCLFCNAQGERISVRLTTGFKWFGHWLANLSLASHVLVTDTGAVAGLTNGLPSSAYLAETTVDGHVWVWPELSLGMEYRF